MRYVYILEFDCRVEKDVDEDNLDNDRLSEEDDPKRLGLGILLLGKRAQSLTPTRALGNRSLHFDTTLLVSETVTLAPLMYHHNRNSG